MGGQQSKSSQKSAVPQRISAVDASEEKVRDMEDSDDEKGELRRRERQAEALPLDVVAALPSRMLRDPKNR